MQQGTVLVACNKQNIDPNQSVGKKAENIETVGNVEKSLTDAQLINIIKGLDPNYTKVAEIEELLFDNCQLSSPVLRALIDEPSFTDYIIEEMMILSSPISSADLSYLHSIRPTLLITAIDAASSVDWDHNEFGVLNSSPRQIVIAKGLTRTALCPTSCGESEWTGINLQVIALTSITTPLDPSEMIACDAGKWVCGKLTESRIVLNEGATTIVVSKCEGTTDNCIRKVAKTK